MPSWGTFENDDIPFQENMHRLPCRILKPKGSGQVME